MGRNSFKVIIAAIAIFLLVGAAYGQPVDPIQRRDNTWYGNNYFTKSIVERVTIANLPSNDSTNPGNLRWVTDSSNDDCVTDGGSTLVMCYDDGTQWQPVWRNATVPTWSQVMGVGNSYFSANSPANGAQIGTSGSYILIYDDATEGPQVVCVVGGVVRNCNRNFKLNSGYNFSISNSAGETLWKVTEAGVISGKARSFDVELVVTDFATDTATGDGQYYFRVPPNLNGATLAAVRGSVITAGTTGTINVDLARCAVTTSGNACSGTVADMLSTNLTIDSGENSSADAAAAAVINTANDDVSEGQFIRVDVDAVHTTAAKGLILVLTFEGAQ